ncbi:MAG: type II secretion system inner membrane protein GspF [Deltaproteobacteria bacterium]|nr:type II secretion system inner membrane protein GspF [Deltaproteobacteria bacterium]
MPVYAYKGLDARGKEVKGLLDSESPRSLRASLKKDGVRVIEHREENASKNGAAKGSSSAAAEASASISDLANTEVDLGKYLERITVADIALCTRQLATLVKSGITLIDALSAIVDQVDNEKLKKVFGSVKSTVNEGSSLADAMGRHSDVFSELYVSMIRAGEASGALDQVLFRLADFMENQARLRSKILNAMLYPAIMLGVGSIVLGILFVVVIPRITKIFEQVKADLPIQTRLLIFVADTAKTRWWLLMLLAGGAVWLFLRWKRTEAGRKRWDLLVLNAPIVGTVVRMVAVARFSRTLATLLRSGVPLLTALDIVKDVLANSRLAEVVVDARDAIREGEPVAAPLRRSKEFPPIVIHMIAIGEASGQLENMLENAADNYDFQVNQRVDTLTTLIEPIMIVVMGIGVAYIVFSILVPILQLSQHVR